MSNKIINNWFTKPVGIRQSWESILTLYKDDSRVLSDIDGQRKRYYKHLPTRQERGRQNKKVVS